MDINIQYQNFSGARGTTSFQDTGRVVPLILSSVTHRQNISLSFLSQLVIHRQNPLFSLSDSFIGCFIVKKVTNQTNKRTVTILIQIRLLDFVNQSVRLCHQFNQNLSVSQTFSVSQSDFFINQIFFDNKNSERKFVFIER